MAEFSLIRSHVLLHCVASQAYLNSPVGVIKQTGTAVAGNIAVSLYNVWTDQIGAPRVITRNTDEAMVWRWDMAEPFGATAPDQNPAGLGTFSFNQRLPGQVFDAESGLFQNWHREYNPRIGRYMQSDPIGLQGGINTFAYAGGQPTGLIDPMGLNACRMVLNLGIATVWHCPPTPPIPGRPKDMNPKEESHYDRHCKNTDDPCGALKAATMTQIGAAKGKMERMLSDPNRLFQFAFYEPNFGVTGTNTTWTGHADDLNGNIATIWQMIALGRKMGCDMSQETALALTLLTPGAPR